MDAAWPPTWPKIAEELYIFDPRGDVLLILERRPEKDMAEYVDEAPKCEDEARPAEYEEPALEEPALDWLQPEPSVEEPQAEEPSPYELDTVEPEAEAEQEKDSTRPGSSVGSISTASCMVKPEIQQVQMRVSSRHLILASATFRAYLGSDKFSEGRTLQTKGNAVVLLADEDPDAMVIVLHIIHGLTRKVPRQVSLEMLSRLAFVVNHRQMHEAVELFSDIWIENLKQNPLPGRYTPEVLSWLFIFWVFQKEDGFRNMSQILERESDHSLEDEADAGPPLPASIIGNIGQNRLYCIESTIQVIYDLITKYSGPEIICCNDRFACDAILLGSLLKRSATIGISPRPKNPYPGMTFKRLAEQIREMQVLDNCGHTSGDGTYYDYINGNGIKDSIEASLRSLEDRMCGLKLESFLPHKTTMKSKCGFF
ncbi:uncharacterized protein PAC_17519 [Phialocephala subalpina]|uniref:BTB domain-containing protein n=1 Tax=Phialocephala subalpina TaxID=576137 RepID=A0A1L7XRF9_9HELO|nr:uncharacterized protein PAC_17519 [Phialocephala subalpina]